MMKHYFLIIFLSISSCEAIFKLNYGDREQIWALLQPLLPQDPIILDAGAFDGGDTVGMSEKWPAAKLYAFEPVPALFNILKKRTIHNKQIHVYDTALSDKDGVAVFFISELQSEPGIPSQSSSLRPPKLHLEHDPQVAFRTKITVQTKTLNSWAKLNNVKRIDFMWLDMQGHELTMLQEATDILPTVKFIYSEVSFVEVYENQPLYKDMKTWLETQGFELFGLDFDETHAAKGKDIRVGEMAFGNALFIRKSHKQKMQSLNLL